LCDCAPLATAEGGLVATVLPIYEAAHQTTSNVSDAGSTVRRHQLLGPETATPRRWVNDARPDKKRPHWKL
jgi:hypothetical protein